MAVISDKEQYLTFKGFPEIVTQIAAGDNDVSIKIRTATIVEVNSDTVAMLMEIEKDGLHGCKNPQGYSKLCWKFVNTAEKKFYKDTVKVSRLEKTIYKSLKDYVGLWFSGQIIVSCSTLVFNQFEIASDDNNAKNLLASLLSFDITVESGAPTFDVPAIAAKPGGYQSAKQETEAEKLAARDKAYKDASTAVFVNENWGNTDLPLSTSKNPKKAFVAQMSLYQLTSSGNLNTSEIIKLADYLFD